MKDQIKTVTLYKITNVHNEYLVILQDVFILENGRYIIIRDIGAFEDVTDEVYSYDDREGIEYYHTPLQALDEYVKRHVKNYEENIKTYKMFIVRLKEQAGMLRKTIQDSK